MDIDTIVLLDTETTGTDPKQGAALLEVAWVVLTLPPDGVWAITGHDSFLIEHTGPIPAEARAVHHISPEMVAPGAPNVFKRDAVIGPMLAAETNETVYAAHNAPFDRSFLPELGRPWICTYQCARHLYPDAPRYGNQVLRYHLGLEPRPELTAGLEAHRALYDTAVTAELLLHMLQSHSAAQLVELTKRPVLLTTCHLKKHKDVPWADVPKDYLRWIADKTDMLQDDANLRHTVNHYLGRNAA